ncbi:helix-turn-helix domain-containing protein [Kitasatospora sp. NPDC051853]|uniref:helix-turn-helix domain-containing protein n=1 Tax=Kitasatospora sp. NPDC051853 TaxID=3364058 RepID=UPI00378BF482
MLPGQVPDGAFTVLELLAQEAPPEHLDEVVRAARRAGVPTDELERLEQARQLALRVHSMVGRRRQREAGLSTLVDTARDLTMPYDLDELLKVITRRARLLLNLDMSYISLHDPAGGFSYVRTADGHATTRTVGFKVYWDSGVGALAHANSAPFWTPDYLPDERFDHADPIDEVVRAEGLRAMMTVPLRHGSTSLGTLYVAARTIRYFSPDEVALMSSLADLAAIAIEKARQLDRTQAEVLELELDTSRARSHLTEVRELGNVQSRLIEQVLAGGDLTALLGEVAGAFGGELSVHGEGGEQLASVGADFGGLGAGAPAGLAPGELVAAYLDAHAAPGPVALPGGVWATAVTAGTERLGLLLVRPSGGRLDERHRRLLCLTAQSVALLLVLLRSAAVAEGPLRDELLDDLLADPSRPEAQLRERARRLSVDPDAPHVLVVARPEGGAPGRAIIWASSYAHRTGGLKCVRDGRLVLLLPGRDPSAAARAVREELTPLLGHPVTVGAAGPGQGPAGFARLFQEARRTLEALGALGGTGTSAAVADLGFLGLLLAEHRDVDGFVAATVGPVLDYDRQRFTELTRTLLAYFESGGSPTYAAESLHVHPNTVSRRLERITELLGPDWQKPAQALELQLALRLHRTRGALGT